MREQPLCPDCEAIGVIRVWDEVDHTIPLERGGTNDRDNRVGLCKPHHEAKTAQDRGYKAKTPCDAEGWPTDPGHHWNG